VKLVEFRSSFCEIAYATPIEHCAELAGSRAQQFVQEFGMIAQQLKVQSTTVIEDFKYRMRHEFTLRS
jgi:hypothetical protein